MTIKDKKGQKISLGYDRIRTHSWHKMFLCHVRYQLRHVDNLDINGTSLSL